VAHQVPLSADRGLSLNPIPYTKILQNNASKLAVIDVNQSASMNKLLAAENSFMPVTRWRPLKKKKYGDQTTFHYLSFKPSLDLPSDSLDTGFKRPKSQAPKKVSILCRDHLESFKWPYLVIFKG